MGADITNAKLSCLGIGAVDTLIVNVANARLRNNGAVMAIILSINITSNCLKGVRGINAYIISRLGAIGAGKAGNRVAIGVTTSVCKDWNC